jgi:parallel beta-helix repeat protein
MAKKGNRRKSIKRQRPFRFSSAHIALSVLLIGAGILIYVSHQTQDIRSHSVRTLSTVNTVPSPNCMGSCPTISVSPPLGTSKTPSPSIASPVPSPSLQLSPVPTISNPAIPSTIPTPAPPAEGDSILQIIQKILEFLRQLLCLLLGTCDPSAPGPQDPANPQNPLQPGSSPAPSGAAVSPVSCPTTPASANALYVSQANGSDANPCTQASPCKTINGGIAKMKGGDTLIIKPGKYDEILNDYGGVTHASGTTVAIPGGSPSAPTTIKGEQPGTVTITSSIREEDCAGVVCLTDAAEYLAFENLTIDNNWINNWSVGLGSRHVRFQNVEIMNAHQGFQGSADDSQFINLHVHNIAVKDGKQICPSSTCANPPDQPCPGYCHGFYVGGTNIVVDGGVWHDIDGYSIHSYSKSNATVRNLTAYNNYHGAIGFFAGTGHNVYNNLLYNNGGGIALGAGTGTVTNNTLYNNKNVGIILGEYSSGSTISNNIIYGSEYGIIAQKGGTAQNNLFDGVKTEIDEATPGILTQTVKVTGNPQFVNPTTDFHLQSGSPAKSAGTDGKDLGIDFTQFSSGVGPNPTLKP